MEVTDCIQDDLELVERVFLKIIFAETDEQFQTSLGTFLPPVLLKFDNESLQVKNKLVELLSHVNKRLHSRPKILLPTEVLIKQYLNEFVALTVKNFTIIYVKMGYLREKKESQLDLLPQMLLCLSVNQVKHQTMILQTILLQLSYFPYPDDLNEKKKLLYFADNSEVRKYMLEYFQDFLLLPYNFYLDYGIDKAPPPALSKAACLKFKMDPSFSKEEIELAKIGILKFLSLHVFPECEVVIPLIAGLGDAKQSIIEKAEQAVKAISHEVLENLDVVTKLMHMFQGTPSQLQNKVPADAIRMPSSIRQKKKIFPFILKSKLSTNFNPIICLQIIFECLFGNESNLKIKHFTVDFIKHICIHGNEKTMEVLSALLYQALSKVSMNKSEENQLRSKAFSAFTALSKRSPVTFRNDIEFLKKLFIFLEEEEPEICIAVQDVISSIALTYTGLSEVNLNIVQSLLLNNLKKTLPRLRLASLQLANVIFPSNHAISKYICLLALDDSIDSIKEAALQGLKLVSPLPSYSDICTCIFEKMKERKLKYEMNVFSPTVYQKILWYIQECFHFNANISDQDELNGLTLKKSILFFNTYIAQYQSEDLLQSPVGWHLSLIFDALTNSSDTMLHFQALTSLIDLTTALPHKISLLLADKLDMIELFAKSMREEVRLLTAHLISVVVCTMNNDVVTNKLSHLVLSFHSKNFEEMHSAILITSLTISRCYLYFKHKDLGKRFNECYNSPGFQKIVQETIEILFFKLNDANRKTSSVCCFALGEIAKYNKLPIPDNDENKISKAKIVDELIKIFQNATEIKLKETAAISLGNICVGEPDIFNRSKIEDFLIESSKMKETEIQFTIGQVFSCVAGGILSKLAKDKYVLDDEFHNTPLPKTERMIELIQRINNECVHSHLAHVRRAAAVWLLSIVKFVPDHEGIEKSILVIQAAFINLLNDSEEEVQDSASRGLGLIYDQIKKESRELLVSALVETLLSGKHSSTKVEKDSEIFKAGVLGKTPDGSNLSTYKELCSLATSMNKPDLIYKFMSLATHNAMWNSKKGAAFGFLSIASIAGEELKVYLPEIIPKLYRYQYDPNLSVQKAMSNIWLALVPDHKKTVEKYANEIFEDILSNITSNLWRTRQSCCFALNDLVRTCPAENLVTRLPTIWKLLFKVMDDIKESVRSSAVSFGKTLSRISIQFCDTKYSKVGEKAVEEVLPVLLDIGLSSRVEEIKTLSMDTLVQITKNAGALLRPHVSKFIISLLESLSALEPEYLNTLNLQLSQNQEAQEKLDIMRLSACKTSPMMEAVNFCSQYVDEVVLIELIPKLCDLLKTGLGLGTKVGCTTLINLLIVQCNVLLSPYAGKLLGSLLNGLTDYNMALKKAYANSIGHLVQYAKEATMSKLLEKLRKWYFEKEDTSIHLSCALALNAMSKYSSDVFYQYHGVVLPLVFVARQNGSSDKLSPIEKDIQEMWEEIWNNNTSGNISAIKLYIKEIFDDINQLLTSQSWFLRTKAAKSIIAIAENLGSFLSQLYLKKFIHILLQCLHGRTWPGKEFILKALSTLTIKCRKEMIDSISVNEILNKMIKECEKDNLSYKLSAVDCFTSVANEWQIDVFEEFKPVLKTLFEQKFLENEDNQVEKQDLLLCAGYESLGRLWPYQSTSQKIHFNYTASLFTNLLNNLTWKTQKALLIASTSFVERTIWSEACHWYNEDETNIVTAFLNIFVTEVFKCMKSTAYSSVKLQTLKFFNELYSSAKPCNELYNVIKPFEDELISITISCKESTNFDITNNSLELLKSISSVSTAHLNSSKEI
ncbi:proteasome adapter and scaffold protein ECM29 isoform X1 [Hydra vulgaris]|uniref:proteasome adapter and scaffold protein ECM29 isoform X1 n=1 Tax=Hydra vulgaris TaxID=6087 RepID=UPI001F5F429B|nr:proteasome adapter and scaffold protein ECM29 [Hydra vulgaris]